MLARGPVVVLVCVCCLNSINRLIASRWKGDMAFLRSFYVADDAKFALYRGRTRIPLGGQWGAPLTVTVEPRHCWRAGALRAEWRAV